MNNMLKSLTLAALFILAPQTIYAGTILTFGRVTSNAATNIESQLQVEVLSEAEAETKFSPTDFPAGQVVFAFTNNVGVSSSISEIYFDDGTIMGTPTIFNSLGGSTDFTNGANPSNLPGGNTVSPPFVATQLFSADAVGNPSKGVDTAADVVALSFALIGGQDFDDVITSLTNGDLRVGMHVRAIGPASDSFVNNPVPEPSTLALAVLALAAVPKRRR